MQFKGKVDSDLKTKVERQNEAIDIWVSNKGVGTFNHCPRFGKLYEGAEVVRRLLNKDGLAYILILVPSDIIYQQWHKHLMTLIGPIDNYNVFLITLHKFTTQYNKYKEMYFKLIVIDEIHRFVSSNTTKVLIPSLVNNSKFRLGLLGVLPDKEDRDFIHSFAPIIDTITEREAIDNTWISDYVEYNIPLVLPDEDKIKYASYSIPMKDLLQQFRDLHKQFKVNDVPIFDNELELIIACYSGKKLLGTYASSDKVRQVVAKLAGWHHDLNFNNPVELEIDNRWNPVNLYERCKTFKNLMDKRNEILINNKVKAETIISIMKECPVPTIIFNESIDFVDTVTEMLNDNGIKSVAYHSKIESRPLINPKTGQFYLKKSDGEVKIFGKKLIKDYATKGLNAGYFITLVTVKSLDEGFTCESIEQVITTAGSTNPVNYSQRIARGNTINPYNKEKVTRVLNLFFDDFNTPDNVEVKSRDKAKLIKRQKYSKSVIWLKNLAELFGI